MQRRQFSGSLAAFTALALSSQAKAMTNSQLARQALLKISNARQGSETLLSFDEFQNLPVATIETVTPWTDGKITFEGVWVKDLVEKFGAGAKMGQATAFNDYRIKFELPEIVEKGGFLAFKRDGEPMSRRDKGPYWLIFPWSDRPELDTRTVHGLSIWQLVDLSFS